MIEIGKNYRLTTLELTDVGYDRSSIVVTVTGREGNLIQVNGHEIINMMSPLFHSLDDQEAGRAHSKRVADDFEALLGSRHDEAEEEDNATGTSSVTGY